MDNQNGGVNIDGDVSIGNDLVGRDKIELHLHGEPDNKPIRAACPRCGKNDMSQKVSGVYRSPSVSQRLYPPSKPEPESISFFWYIAPFIYFLDLFLIFMAPISKKTKLAFVGIAVALIIEAYIESSLNGGSSISHITGWAPWIAIILTIVVYYWGLRRESRRRIKVFQEQKRIPIWEKAMNMWNSLYYCSRDDCVFDPETNVCVPVEKMNEVLYG